MPDPIYNAGELARGMANLGLDSLIVRSGRNVAYLSGMRFPGTLGRLQDFAYSPRAVLLLMPRDGDATLIASNIAAGLAQHVSWVEDIQTYAEYVQSPFAEAARVARDRGFGAGCIGIERREFGVEHWEELRRELPHAELIDCTDMLEGVRNIKTPAELELLRTAVEIQDAAHLEVFANARAGETERELHSRMVASMINRGAESAHGMLQASTTPATYGGEGDATIDPGVVVRTDYVCYYQGYAANLSRMAVMGAASTEQRAHYQDVLDIHRATVEQMLRPGVRAEDVYDFVRQRLGAVDSQAIPGLAGHSIGVWWHQEEPMLAPGEPRSLRPDMVVCLEPILDRFWHLQDEVLITDEEPELLSPMFDTSRLYEMG